MHCNFFIFLASGMMSAALALPPPNKSVVTAVDQKTIPSSIAKVTPLTHSTPTSFIILGDVVTATIVEIGEYPPEEMWTTIHRASSSSIPKAGETSVTTNSAEKVTPTVKDKALKTSKPAVKQQATKSAKVKVAPTHVAPATCTTYYPSIMRQISETYPTVMQEDTANTTRSFHVAQSVSFSDKVKFNRLHQYIGFDGIAAGS